MHTHTYTAWRLITQLGHIHWYLFIQSPGLLVKFQTHSTGALFEKDLVTTSLEISPGLMNETNTNYLASSHIPQLCRFAAKTNTNTNKIKKKIAHCGSRYCKLDSTFIRWHWVGLEFLWPGTKWDPAGAWPGLPGHRNTDQHRGSPTGKFRTTEI